MIKHAHGEKIGDNKASKGNEEALESDRKLSMLMMRR